MEHKIISSWTKLFENPQGLVSAELGVWSFEAFGTRYWLSGSQLTLVRVHLQSNIWFQHVAQHCFFCATHWYGVNE